MGMGGTCCKKANRDESKLTMDMQQEFEKQRSPAIMEQEYIEVLKEIEFSPEIKAKIAELGSFEYDGNFKDISYLTLKKNDTTDPNSTFYGFWDEENKTREYKGVIIYRDGSIYEGHLHNNQPNGRGRMLFTDFRHYKGTFKDGKMHGKGVLISSSGACYDGCWIGGVREGQGTEEVEGEKYVGEFKADVRNGHGIWTKDGNQYEGAVMNGVPEGYGVFFWANGKKYEGEWNDGKPNGIGKMRYKNGTVHEGEFAEGERHGKGVETFPNGDRYEGTWVRNKMEGKITISGKDKPTAITIWENGNLVEVLKNTLGGD